MRALLSSLGLILMAMFSIQLGASIAKQLFPVAGAAGTTALRVTMAAILLSVVAKIWKHNISWKSLPSLAAYGISLGSMNLLFYFALERIPLGIAVALEFTGPLAVALFSSKKSWDILWVLLAGIGIYLLLPVSPSTSNLDVIGMLLALAAGFFWALYIIFGQKAAKHGTSLQVTAWGMWFATLIALPGGMYFNSAEIKDISLWPMGLGIAILSSALPYSLEMKAMRNMPTKTFGILMSMEPAVATLMGLLVLKETLTLPQWMAIACIIAASAGSTATAK